jgi:acetylglutamate kinase
MPITSKPNLSHVISAEDQNRAAALVEALPYIKKYDDQIVLIKYDGSAMIDPELKEKVALDVVLLKYLGMHPVLVHGGGPEITKWLDKAGIKSEFINGLRVTNLETMEIAEMVLGKVAKDIVTLINMDGSRAVSLSGKDGGIIRAKKLEQKDDLGFVGEVESVDSKVILTLIKEGFIPVISSVGMGNDGNTYNINADHMASVLAGDLKAKKLLFLTDVPGVLDPQKKLISKLTEAQVLQMIDQKLITGGMIPKVHSCLEALKAGAESVHIIDGCMSHSIILELLTDKGIGTMITR